MSSKTKQLPDSAAAVPPALIGVQVRSEAELTAHERALLASAGLLDRVPLQVWSVRGTNKQLAYATHGVFRYFGKFPPPIARHLLTTWTVPGELVLDPMVGSGTTAVEAAELGRACVVRDVSPLSLLLTRVKTTHVAALVASEALARVRQRVAATVGSDLPGPIGLRDAGHWFLPDTLRSLARIRAAIEGEPAGAPRELLQVAFAGTVRRVSRATTQQGRLFLDATTAVADAWPTFEDRFAKSAKAVAALPARWAAPIRIEVGDARVVPQPAIAAKLAIVHPPYFNNYKYSAINSLELAWLGIRPQDIRGREIREAFKIGKPEKLAHYVTDMADMTVAVAQQLQPGGILALMMGDTTIRQVYLDVTAQLLAEMARRGVPLDLERVVLRVPQFTEASWVASQRRKGGSVGVTLCDFILLLRRRG